jgi:shikimate dehydrogenase
MPIIGLIGYPLAHSFSPQYFKDKFKTLGLTDWDYQLFPLEHIQDLPALINKHQDLLALNITIPHKESVLRFCTELNPDVQHIGAANLLTIDRTGNTTTHLKAYNTDYYGFTESLSGWYKQIHGKTLVLGTGGSSKAVQYALSKLQLDFDVAGRRSKLNYENLDLSQYQLIVNCTPVGMYSETIKSEKILPLPYDMVNEHHLFYDLVYNPGETEMMKLFENHGAKVKNGLQMLHLQAEHAWTIIYNG